MALACNGSLFMTLLGGTQGWNGEQSDFKSWVAVQDGCCMLIRQKQAADNDLIVQPWLALRPAGDVLPRVEFIQGSLS